MQLNEQKNNLIFKKETHQYFLNKKELISVSKILDYYLGNSYCKCNNCKFCVNIKNAKNRGNLVHKVAELYFKNINQENIIFKIKEKIKPLFIKNYLDYSFNLLDYLEKRKFKKDNEYISEQMYSADIVAGTPDLIFKTSLDLYSIIDFKTYKVMTKELKEKAELQLTAYYWILNKNNFKLTNQHFIIWIQQDKVETISVEITKEKLHEWEMAIALWKEDKHGKFNFT